MKNFIIEKGIIVATIFFSIHNSQQTPTKTEPIIKETVKTNAIKPMNIDSLVVKDKEIMEEYNTSVIKKNEINNKVISVSKKEVENSKLINKLTDKLIKKIQENKDCKVITSDTICTKTQNRLFKKSKCIERQITFYYIEDNKKVQLQTIKIK